MELRLYLNVLWRRKWIILLTTAAAVAAVAIGLFRTPPTYSATALVRIAPLQTADRHELPYADRVMNTYATILTTRSVTEAAARRLGQVLRAEDLRDMVEIEGLSNSELVGITAQGGDPKQVAEIANVFAEILIEEAASVFHGQGESAHTIIRIQLERLDREIDAGFAAIAPLAAAATPLPGNSPPTGTEAAVAAATAVARDIELRRLEARVEGMQVTYVKLMERYENLVTLDVMQAGSVDIVERARTPDSPSAPDKALLLAAGLLAGLAGGLLLAFVIENLSTENHPPQRSAE